jgi:hypothetical protein
MKQNVKRQRAKKQPILRRIKRSQPRGKAQPIQPALATTDVPSYTNDKRTKICLIQTGSWGDNINSTLMFQPIKDHFGNCVLDVHTSTHFGSAFINNPYIDNLVQYEATSKQSALHLTLTIPEKLKTAGYDLTLAPHPMYNPGKWSSLKHPELRENLIFAWVRALEEADIPYNLPLETVLQLTHKEMQTVENFVKQIPTMQTHRNILMEIQGDSGQTFWDHTWTIDVGKHLLSNKKTNLFLSRKHNSGDIAELTDHAQGRVFFVGELSLRECAQLFNHCQIFFSVSSGLSNACNTNWCKNDIQWIETINSTVVSSAPVRKEGKVYWIQQNRKKFIAMLKDEGI